MGNPLQLITIIIKMVWQTLPRLIASLQENGKYMSMFFLVLLIFLINAESLNEIFLFHLSFTSEDLLINKQKIISKIIISGIIA